MQAVDFKEETTGHKVNRSTNKITVKTFPFRTNYDFKIIVYLVPNGLSEAF